MAKHLFMSERTFFLIVFKYFKSCSFIIVYKEKCCASTNKNSSANLISMIKGALCLWYGIWEFHFGPLVFTFYFNIGISTVELKKWNTDLSQITCIEEKKNMAVEKNLKVTIKLFLKKYCLPVVTWNKNNSSKQVAPITCTLEKRFFAVPILLKVCELFLFRQSNLYNTLVCMSFL